MASIKDEKGYNQGFVENSTLEIRTERRVDYILHHFNNKDNCNVLELGCGTGMMSYFLAKKIKGKVLGIDISSKFIDIANAKYKLPNLNYEVKNVSTDLTYSAGEFDYIIGNGILHHVYYNIDKVLEDLKKLLKKDGKIIFIEPNLFNPYIYLIFNIQILRKIARLEPDEMAFSKRFINKKLVHHNFSDITVNYIDLLLPVTPKKLIPFIIKLGNLLEKTFFKIILQSTIIAAKK